MNVLSLFDGISCGQVALERAGVKVDTYYASEIDDYAIKVTQKNYPNTIQIGDIFKADFSKLKPIDIVIGGSPCTYWSIAKGSDREITSTGLGFELFMQFKRALDETSSKYFLYENNYSIHQNIKDAISEKLGVQPIMINSSLVSAQSRKRCYWTNIPNVLQPTDKGILLQDILEKGIAVRKKSKTVRVGGRNSSDRHEWDLATTDGRRYTPLECERLQTLPDNYTEGIPDTQRYKCIGNGWTVDVISHILKYI